MRTASHQHVCSFFQDGGTGELVQVGKPAATVYLRWYVTSAVGAGVPEAARGVSERQGGPERQEEEKGAEIRQERRSRLQDPERGESVRVSHHTVSCGVHSKC